MTTTPATWGKNAGNQIIPWSLLLEMITTVVIMVVVMMVVVLSMSIKIAITAGKC